MALDSLGFVELRKEGQYNRHLTLYSSAFHRAKFEQKLRLLQWVEIGFLQYKDYMALIAFVLSVWLAWKELFG